MVIGLWLAVNPFIFGKPADQRNWATRAMLGEEQWVAQRPKDAATLVSGVTSIVAVVAIISARRRRLVPAGVATAVQMALTMVYWAQMVRYFDRQMGGGGSDPQ